MESDVRPSTRLRMTEDEFGTYDVFISHRGPDTKTSFVGFLYERFEAARLRPFLDCISITKGQDAWTCIDRAIKTTSIAVVIFSESFAQSEWCLKELHVMLDDPGVKVIPVFYKVQPWEVNFPEKGQLAAGFEKLKERHDEALIEQWREDLRRASKLNGWEHKVADQRLETDLVKEIVNQVFELANKPLPLDVGDNVLGVDRVAEEIIQKLDDNKRVLMLGLWGMGGIGKSTLARELYNRLSRQFTASCYVEDVTDKVIQGGVVKVQNCILKDLCTNEAKKVKDKSKGKAILEERLCKNRILLVLDDVRDNHEMDYWITRKMFTRGSMCIVTSRDKRVFETSNSFDIDHEVHIHRVQGLSSVDSKRVFATHAFGCHWKEKQGFEKLVANISKACGGVPLVLKVCGARLKNEANVDVWIEVMEKLNSGTIMDESKIFESLRISYDSLQGHQPEMFLDIACALLGESKDMAICVWHSRGWSAALDVRSLVEKALVTINSAGCFTMHDHLRDMGREIERRGRTREGAIKRLWMPESLTFLKENEQLPDSLQTLIIDIDGCSPFHLNVSQMKGLRILICDYSTDVTLSLPKNLSWFGLREHSFIQWLPESFGELSNLQVLNMSYIHSLSCLPHSFGGLKSLRHLNLESCTGIQRLPESFGELSNLQVLNMSCIGSLSCLPHSFGGLKSLPELDLAGCTEIQRLPESFGELSNLQVLNMSCIGSLSCLPHSFGGLKSLPELDLAGCTEIQRLPESFGELSNLQVLNMSCIGSLSCLPHSFGGLKSLRHLNLETCSRIQRLPESFGELSNLEVLNMSCTGSLSCLPHSFGGLKSLRELDLAGCTGIQRLPESFGELSNLQVPIMEYSWSLNCLPHSFGGLKSLRELDLGRCSQIQRLPESFGELSNLQVLNMEYS